MALLHLGLTPATATTAGALTPVVVLIALNIAGAFQTRTARPRTLRPLRRWVAGLAGRRHGLVAEHSDRASLADGNRLRLIVTVAWAAQGPDKRLADLAGWSVLWGFCLSDYDGPAAVNLIVGDAAGWTLGGTGPGGGLEVWVEE